MKWNYIIRIFTVIILIITVNSSIFSQDEISNLKKYWFYRNRLKYFVYPGQDKGESIVSTNRNGDGGGTLIVQDNPLRIMGYYIGTLATEYWLLADNGQNTSETGKELKLALEAVERLDFYNTGYLIRDDTPDDFLSNSAHNDYLNKNLVDDNWWSGYGYGYDDIHFVKNVSVNGPKAMSQDEIVGLFIGLGLTAKLLSGSECGDMAKQQIVRIINYVRLGAWNIIRLPDVSIVPPGQGGYLGWAAFGYAAAASHLTGYPVTDFYDFVSLNPVEGTTGYAIWQGLQLISSYGDVIANRMTMTLGIMGNSWKDPTGIINTTVVSGSIFCQNYDWNEFYLLLWRALNNNNSFPTNPLNSIYQITEYNIQNEAYVTLNLAPASGTYCYQKGDNGPYYMTNTGGWASFLKYENSISEQWGSNSDNLKGSFTGLDYMLLFNLYRLSLRDYTGDDLPAYENLLDKDLYGYLPVHFKIFGTDIYLGTGGNAPLSEIDAFNSITSDMTIGKQTQDGIAIPGNVTYRAGDAIDLKPGFTVEKGATFTAYVQPFSSNSDFHLKSMDTTATAGLYDFHYDTLEMEFIRPYYTPLSENYVAELEMLKNAQIESPKPDTLKFNNYDIFSIAAYPNPFNNTTTIEYNIPYSTDVNISIFDIYGSKIMQPINQYLEKGEHSNTVNMSHISKGIYYCKLKSGNQSKTIKLVLSN